MDRRGNDVKRHKLALEPLTFAGLPGTELLKLAHRTGYEYSSLTLIETRSGEFDPLVTDAGLRRETAHWLREVGLGLQTIEVFNLTPAADPARFAPAIAAAAELGARGATAILWENPDHEDALRKFVALCDVAAGSGIRINLEFFPSCRSMGSLPAAQAFLDRAGRDEAGLVMDILHVMRSAGSLEVLEGLDRRCVGAVQLCDGPVRYDGDLLQEAGLDRGVPGTGSFPCREFLAWLPDDVIVGLEVPQRLLDGKVPLDRRASDLREAALALYA